MAALDIVKLLVNDLPDHYRLKHRATETDLIVEEHVNEVFMLSDETSCNACDRSCKDKEVAKMDATASRVYSIDIENLLMRYNRSRRFNTVICDYLHIDEGMCQIVFNELTCTKLKYIEPYDNTSGHHEGKRIHAIKQMLKVAELLTSVPTIKNYIVQFGQKTVLFSWRNPEVDEPATNAAEESMMVFDEPSKIAANTTLTSMLPDGFIFVQQLYPKRFSF